MSCCNPVPWKDEDSCHWNLNQIRGIGKPRRKLWTFKQKGGKLHYVIWWWTPWQVVLPSLACLSFRILSRRDWGIFWKASSDGARMVQGCCKSRNRVTNPDCCMALASSEKRPSWKYSTSLFFTCRHVRLFIYLCVCTYVCVLCVYVCVF